MAKRDDVWHSVLIALIEDNEFKISELDVDVSEQTKRRVCRSMESKGWLSRESSSSSIWRRGPLARVFLAERSWPNPVDAEELPTGHVEDLQAHLLEKYSPELDVEE